MINEAMFSSNTAEWATPQAFFDELKRLAEYNKEYGTAHEATFKAKNDPKSN